MSELKPCPFCGGDANAIPSEHADDCYFMVMRNVKLNKDSADCSFVFDAIEAWNRRAQPAQAGQVLTDEELAALMPPPDIDGSKARSPNAVRLAMRAVEQAVLAKRVPQWLPIETAPKGQRVMVWVADKEAGENIAFAKVWFHADGTLGGGAEGFNGKWDLTHWMPLPPPPGIVGKGVA